MKNRTLDVNDPANNARSVLPKPKHRVVPRRSNTEFYHFPTVFADTGQTGTLTEPTTTAVDVTRLLREDIRRGVSSVRARLRRLKTPAFHQFVLEFQPRRKRRAFLRTFGPARNSENISAAAARAPVLFSFGRGPLAFVAYGWYSRIG